MSGICYRCESRETGSFKTIEFEHEGFQFSVFKSGLLCTECGVEETIEQFERINNLYEEPLVTKGSDGRVQVNWVVHSQFRSVDRGDEANSLLYHLGVLRFEHDGNWAAFDGGIMVAEYSGGAGPYFFTEKRHINGYLKSRYGKIPHFVNVVKMIKED